MSTLSNLFRPLHPKPDEEIFEELLRGKAFRLERIVSTGQTTPPGEWYDQPQSEWVLLLTGRARLRLQDPEEILEMKPGDMLVIPAHRRHRVEWTDPDAETLWLALHYD